MSLDLSFNDSFLKDDKMASVEDYLMVYDQKLNQKMASCFKKVTHLLIQKMDNLMDSKIKVLVHEELEIRLTKLKLNNFDKQKTSSPKTLKKKENRQTDVKVLKPA